MTNAEQDRGPIAEEQSNSSAAQVIVGGEPSLLRAATATLARSIALTALATLAGVAVVTALACWAARVAVSGPIGLVAGVATIATASGVLVASRLLARAIACAAVQPVEMLTRQLAKGGPGEFRWESGRVLSGDDVRHDLDILQRRVRLAERRNLRMIADQETARERAIQQDLVKSQFLTNMSHELRTPLNAILGYAMLLHEDAAEAKNLSAMADLDRIQQAGRNLLSSINDILDLAKLETGKTVIQRNVINVGEMVRRVTESYQTSAARHGNELTWDVPAGTTLMIGDEARIVQCLNHLLGNAFKFTTEGQVHLDVSRQERECQTWMEFAVCDTGIGIEAADLDRLFDPFHQIDGSATRQHGGMGYGLAIVRQLAIVMGGECIVESTIGEGSLFRLCLPAGSAVSDADASRLKPEWREPSTPASGTAARTALVIDDDEAVIDLVRRWMARVGYDVLSATDGETGVKLAYAHRPDIILLDALLPGRSGYELAEELRNAEATAHIPTVLITVDDDRTRGLRCGATDYLRKPITEGQIRELVELYRGQVVGEVLVIEDDDDAADIVARCVAEVGFSSRRAANGAQGLAMAVAKRPDAIVLDLALPTLNGFEVLDRLGAIPQLQDVPLIVFSGAEISLEEHGRLARAGLRFLPKGASTPREIAQSLKELVA